MKILIMNLLIVYLVGYIVSFLFMVRVRYKDLSYYNYSGDPESEDKLLTKSLNYSMAHNWIYPIYWFLFLLKYISGKYILKLNYKIDYSSSINHIFRTL